MFSFRFSVLHLASTKSYIMSQLFFWCIWWYSMYVGFSQPPIHPSIQSVVDQSCPYSAIRFHPFWCTWEGIYWYWCTGSPHKLQHWTVRLDWNMTCWSQLSWPLDGVPPIASSLTMYNFLHHFSHSSISLKLIFTAYTLSPTFPNFVPS